MLESERERMRMCSREVGDPVTISCCATHELTSARTSS